MSSAKKNDVKPVTRSNASSAKGSDCRSPWTQLGLRDAAAGDREQVLRRVEARDLRAAVGAQPQEDARAAADVEDPVARTDARALERGLVDRQLLLLVPGPVAGPVAPQRAPEARGGGELK